jgi:CBS domain-containing protein
MRARDLAKQQARIPPHETVRRAVELVAEHGPLLVVDDERGLLGVLSDETLLRGLLPAYVQAQELLAGVLDEEAADSLFAKARDKRVGDLLVGGQLPLVQGDDSLIEVASVMVTTGSHLVAVQDGQEIIGGITISDLLARLTR